MACKNDQFNNRLQSYLMTLSVSSVTDCIKVMTLLKCLQKGGGIEGMNLIANKLVTHPVRGINREAGSLLLEMLLSNELTVPQLKEIMSTLEHCKIRYRINHSIHIPIVFLYTVYINFVQR